MGIGKVCVEGRLVGIGKVNREGRWEEIVMFELCSMSK